jgi:hypothetical protein
VAEAEFAVAPLPGRIEPCVYVRRWLLAALEVNLTLFGHQPDGAIFFSGNWPKPRLDIVNFARR